MSETRRVLILRRRAVGDIVVSLPVVRAVRAVWPEAAVGMVVDRMAAELVAHSGVVDEVLVYAPPASGVARLAYDLKWIAKLRARNYDVTLDLMGTPQTAQWTGFAGSRLRVGRKKRWRSWAYNHLLAPCRGEVRFAGDELMDFARALGAAVESWGPAPVLPAGDPGPGDAPPAGEGPWVVLHAPANWEAKAWPLRHWIELVRELADAGIERLELSWGPGEEEWRDAIVDGSGGLVRAMPPTTLLELARRLSRCDLLISIDSGPVHLAVAEGTPTLTLFGSTDERGWHHPASIHRALVHTVECRPCNLTVCPVEGHPCLDALLPERVRDAALELLAQREGERR